MLRDVSTVDTRTSLFGFDYSLPVGIAPSAMQRLASGLGELDTARAAVRLNLNMTLSSQSTTSLEDVQTLRDTATSNPADVLPPLWFQLYLTKDIKKSVPLIARAEGKLFACHESLSSFRIADVDIAAGYEALVLTVDTPVLGNRLNERKVPVALPSHLRLANIEPTDTIGTPRKPTFNRALMDARTSQQAKNILHSEGASMHSSSLTWDVTLKALRNITNMKIILKGIMCGADADLAVAHGADAIIVSNHGGRQLDCTVSTLEMLPDIVASVHKRIPVIMDGGVRRGSDVLKALCLGADFVLVGRPALWGLAYNGQEGVETCMHILERELSRAMALVGATSVNDLGPHFLARDTGRFALARL